MKVEKRFYVCKICGKVIELMNNAKTPTICCGKEMTELKANTTDAATEKHVPKLLLDGNKLTVSVGEVPHPMADEHYIEWVVAAQNNLSQRIELKPGDEPTASFSVLPEDLTVYIYCNLHGLWANEL